MKPSTELEITPASAAQPLTPAQKRFNKLLKDIDKAKATLQAWQTNISGFRQSHQELLKPLQDALTGGNRSWALALDAALARPGWTQAEKQILREQLCEAAAALLEDGPADAELQALFEKHAGHDFSTELRERTLAFKAMAEAMTGLDLGDDEGLNTEEDLFQRLHQGFDDDDGEAAEPPPQTRQRRPSAAQVKREAAAKQAT